MDLGQVFAAGGQVTALGILVVFICLALIIAVVSILSLLLKDRKKPGKKAGKIEQAVERAMEKPMPEMPVVPVEDEELLAVLTAAVSAYMAPETPELVVRSFRRIGGESAWGKAGRNAQIYNKF